jgi:hypothetical protein
MRAVTPHIASSSINHKSLMVAYDKFDETLGKTGIVASIILFDLMTLLAAGSSQRIFAVLASGPACPGGARFTIHLKTSDLLLA